MKYRVKYNLFRTKASLVDEKGVVVATGAQIREFAPSTVKYSHKQPIYIINDGAGLMSVFCSDKADFILTDAQAASPELVCEGAPMLFTKEGKTLYVNPVAQKVFHIPAKDTICFERDRDGKLSHEGVFQVHDGMPYALNITSGVRGSHIVRYPQQDTVENVYAPLLLTNETSVVYYLGGHRDVDYRHLADTYSALEGEKRLATFLPAITEHFTRVVSANGVYTPKRIAELRQVEAERDKERNAARAEIAAERSAIREKIAKVEKQLSDLGLPDYTEQDLRYYNPQDKKEALRRLTEARESATPEVAALYAERDELIDADLSYIGSSRVQSLEDDAEASDSYLYGLRIKEESYEQISKVDDLFAIIQKERGLTQSGETAAQTTDVKEVVETPTKDSVKEL